MLRRLIKYIKSFQFRVFLFILVFGIAPGFAMRQGLIAAYENQAIASRTVDITSQARLLALQIAANDYLSDASSSDSISTQLDQLSTIYDGRAMLIDKSFRIVSDSYKLDLNKIIISQEVILAYQGETIQKFDRDNRYIEMTLPVIDSAGEDVIGVMLVSVSTDSIFSTLDFIQRWSLIIQFCLIVAVVIVAFAVSRAMVRPFRDLTETISDVGESIEADFHTIHSYSETMDICVACDELIGRLRILDHTREEFVSNVSHELKTPMASIKVLADSLLLNPDASKEMYQEFMAGIVSEIDREDQIISDLLSLVKMDQSPADIKVESININELIELIIKRLRPLAQKDDIELIIESKRNVSAEADMVRMTQALTNLIENAIKYNQPGGKVTVSLGADQQNFFVNVADTGIGIPEDERQHVFERFFRVDKSRSREVGGTGLGLSIVKSVVQVHHGTIEVESKEGCGSTFRLCIPLTYVPGV